MFTADVVIVGGGPAGAAIALALARRGISPIVLEAHSAPQMKVGECLPPTINPLLDHFGLTERLRRRGNLRSYGNRFVWGSNSIEERDFILGPTGAGWRLDRATFEDELMQAATEEGARWHYGRRLVACSRERDTRFKLTVKGLDRVEKYRANFVVDATGRSARLAGSLGARRVIYDRLIGVAEPSRAYRAVRSIQDLPKHLLDEIEHFFVSYNEERGRTFRPLGRFGVKRAKALIQRGERLFRKEKEPPA